MTARLGALFAGLGVVLGAFGAHMLKSKLAPDLLEIYTTGVTYQMYHALALFALGVSGERWSARVRLIAASLFVLGIAVFSGSLYLLATSELWAGSRLRWLGAITPIGGTAFIVAWLIIVFAPQRSDR